MDTHTARPTGRRKITLPQLRAETAGAVPLPTETPGRVLAAFKRAEPALGAPAQVVKLIDYLMGRTQAQDWDGSGLGPIAWPSDAERDAFEAPILERYEAEGNPYHATARLWDDGILDPLETRRALSMGIEAAIQAPIPETRFGVFRM